MNINCYFGYENIEDVT